MNPGQFVHTVHTLQPHYNTHFGVHSDISFISEQPYNEDLIHTKSKQYEPIGYYKQMCGVRMRLHCINYYYQNRLIHTLKCSI